MVGASANRQKEFPGLQWDKEYTTETLKNGRCLLIEYILTTTPEGEKKLDERTKEISDLELLRKVYKNGRPPDVSLRLFHIQNWPEACKFVTHKFRLHEVGDAFTDRFGFQDWVMERNMKRRGGKPLLQAKSFKLSVDPRRRMLSPVVMETVTDATLTVLEVSKCAVGLDYLKKYRCMHEGDTDAGNPSMVTGLMGYDQNGIEVNMTCREPR